MELTCFMYLARLIACQTWTCTQSYHQDIVFYVVAAFVVVFHPPTPAPLSTFVLSGYKLFQQHKYVGMKKSDQLN